MDLLVDINWPKRTMGPKARQFAFETFLNCKFSWRINEHIKATGWRRRGLGSQLKSHFLSEMGSMISLSFPFKLVLTLSQIPQMILKLAKMVIMRFFSRNFIQLFQFRKEQLADSQELFLR